MISSEQIQLNRKENLNEKLVCPKISCIVPVYNVEKYLSRCVDSILAQTFTDFELILVDDGSPDNCGKICDEYAKNDARIKVIHQENKGVSAARNAGLDVIQGDFVCFVDSDDWVEKDYMKAMYDAAVETGVDVVVCGYRREYVLSLEDSESKIKDFCYVPKNLERIVYNRDEFFINFPKMRINMSLTMTLHSPWMRLIRRQGNIFLGFDEKISYGEDYIFNLHVYSTMNSICYISSILYNYCCNYGSFTQNYSCAKINDMITMINSTKPFIEEFCGIKNLKYFYIYKKERLAQEVINLCSIGDFHINNDFGEMFCPIRKELSFYIFFTNFFYIKQTIPLCFAFLHMEKLFVLIIKLYQRLKSIIKGYKRGT